MITIAFIITTTLMISIAYLRIISFISKRKKEKLFSQLSKEGDTNGLTFCSQELLVDKLIGIDGIHRKIMILERDKKGYSSSIISLDEVHHCQVVTNENEVARSNFKTFSDQIKSIVLELRFEFNNSHETASIFFAKGLNTSKKEIELLRQKADFWSVMFSKMMTHHVSVRA